MITVEVSVKAPGEKEWTRLEVLPSEYFWQDPDLPEGAWDFDSEPRHLHVARLLPDRQIEFALERVTDSGSGNFRECAYHYWGGPEEYACIATRGVAGQISRELIFTGRMPYKENGSHLVRVRLDQEVPLTTMNWYMWGKCGDEYSESMLGALSGRGHR